MTPSRRTNIVRISGLIVWIGSSANIPLEQKELLLFAFRVMQEEQTLRAVRE
jgi:hypothetical protein